MTRPPDDHRWRRIARAHRRGTPPAPPPREQLELPFDLSDVPRGTDKLFADEAALRAAVRASIEGRGADLTVGTIERAIAAMRAYPQAAAIQVPRRGAAAAMPFADGAATAEAGAETAAEHRLERDGWR